MLAEQKELWQQIPYWAWCADGRSGWSDEYRIAYRDGLWRTHSWLTVDCASGDFVSKNLYIASTWEAIRELNAREILEELFRRATEELGYSCLANGDKGEAPPNPYCR